MKMNQNERRFDFHGLGLAIKQAREERGWTQAYLAELVGKTDRTIMSIENKGQHPSFNLVLVYKCGQEKLSNLYYQVKEQRRCSAWRKTKKRIDRVIEPGI